VTEEIEGLGVSDAARVSFDGPAALLKPKAAIAIGLALHELVSNARRHGALSGARGRVDLKWSVEASNGGKAHLAVTWRESGGPAVAAPETAGFGRATFERELRSEIGAETSLDFAPEGVAATIALPLSSAIAIEDR
jgi:two-component sensor histidine kinase